MKQIIIISLISISCICAYWYLEVANDYQKEFVKEKATIAGQAIKDKGKELYDNRDEYIDKAKEVGQNIYDKGKEVADSIKENSQSLPELTKKHLDSHYFAGQPVNLSYPNEITVLENEGFIVGYDNERKNPAWVCYRLLEETIENGPKQPTKFLVDERTTAKVSYQDFSNTGYLPVQLAPSNDIYVRYGIDAQKETFLMSNIVPQKPLLYHWPWKELENRIGEISNRRNKEIWVITGPIYDNKIEKLNSGIEIPDAYFKIVVDKLPKMGLFIWPCIIEQEVRKGAEYLDFLTSIDRVEELTGLDFFSELDDELENKLEAIPHRR